MYSSPPISAGDTFQNLPRMPETADSSEPYIQVIFRLLLRFGAIIKQNQGLFSQQHCDNAATYADSENARG